MTIINKEIQRQDPGSALIELYEVEYAPNSFARFYAGLDDDDTPVKFRTEAGVEVSYTAVPLQAEGFDITTDGSHSRPEISIGNMGNILTNAIGGNSLESLTGKRLTKRTTLEKYLVGNIGDSGNGNPPTEFPKTVYIIDRLKTRNILQVTYELAAPFDLAGIQLPKRQVIGGSCPFKYKGGSPNLPIQDRIGGCRWTNESVPSFDTSGSNESVDVFMNRYDEYIVKDTITFTTAGGNMTAGNYYKTQNSGLNYISSTGATVALGSGGLNYWQCLVNTSSAPSDTSTAWRRVRVFSVYSPSATYFGFTDSKFNQYVLRNGVLWQVKRASQSANSHAIFTEGENWTAGDVCGKKIKSCRLRFHAVKHATIANGIAVGTAKEVPLPFGGFPSVKQRR